MKIYLLIIVLGSTSLFGMDAMEVDRVEEVGSQDAGVQSQTEERVDGVTAQSTHGDSSQEGVDLVIEAAKDILPLQFLPQGGWYRELLGRNNLPIRRDDQGRYLIRLAIEKDLIKVVEEVLLLMRVLEHVSEYNATQIAYKKLKQYTLSLDQAQQLLLALDYLQVSIPLISAMARIYAELTEGNELDLGVMSLDAGREINRYFYLMYGRYIEGGPKGDVWLQDFIKPKREEISEEYQVRNGVYITLENLSLAHICRLGKLQELSRRRILGVDLAHNNLTDLPEYFVKDMPFLEKLYLNNNELMALPENLGFGDTQLIQLIKVDLSHNQLTRLPKGFAKNWRFLKQLYLNNNRLTAWPEEIGIGCPELEVMSFSHNRLTSLPVFRNNWGRLRQVWLGNNELTTLPAYFSHSFRRLEYLGLEENPFIELPSTFIDALRSLKTLKLVLLKNDELKRSIVEIRPDLESKIT